MKGIINSKSEIKEKQNLLAFTSCPYVMILSLCVCFSLQLGRTHSPWPLGQGFFKTLVQMKPPQWNLSKYGGALMMEKSDITCFMIWMWYIRKYSSLPIKYNCKKVETPSNQAPQSNNQFMGNIWTEKTAKWHPKEAINQMQNMGQNKRYKDTS